MEHYSKKADFIDDRSHITINPYTFIPVREDGAIFAEKEDASQAYFNTDRHTVRIECELELITPAVIPGEKIKYKEKNEDLTRLKTYVYNKKLAIPGSRLRGHICNLMRLINGSPLRPEHYEDRVILKRSDPEDKGICHGILFINDGNYYIKELGYLTKANEKNIGINCDRKIDKEPGLYIAEENNSNKYKIKYDREQSLKKFIDYIRNKDEWHELMDDHFYLLFPVWLGQDGKHRIKGSERTIREWKKIQFKKCREGAKVSVSQDVIDKFNASVDEMVHLAEDSKEDRKAKNAKNIKKQKEMLVPGRFVYFTKKENGKTKDDQEADRIGLHFRFLFYLARIGERISGLKEGGKDKPCIVDGMTGCAKDTGKENGGKRGRLWFEMAIGPEKNDNNCFEYPLRILASLPPKQAKFYLSGGNWDSTSAKLRGRKVYWHDPKWKDPFWDSKKNKDKKDNVPAFENPFTCENKKIWSYAEVINYRRNLKPEERVRFSFNIRCLNLSRNEFNLLLTALVGFDSEISIDDRSNKLIVSGKSGNGESSWCHKIGHARPYLGSAVLRIKKSEELRFDKENFLAELKPSDLGKVHDDLEKWQVEKITGLKPESEHIQMLKRIMNYSGAYKSNENNDNVRISYPLGQDENTCKRNENGQPILTWYEDKGEPLKLKERPMIFKWFGWNDRRDVGEKLPEPRTNKSQGLVSIIKKGNRDKPKHNKKKYDKQRSQTSFNRPRLGNSK